MRKLLLFFYFLLYLITAYAVEGGYSDKLSVIQGSTINFYLSTKTTPFTLSFYRYYNGSDVLVKTISNLVGGERSVPDSSFYYGARWKLSYALSVPTSWTPGVYKVKFPSSIGTQSFQFFVRSSSPGSYSKIAYLSSVNTWEAYNIFGGKSLYDNNPSGSTRAYKVSFLRPFNGTIGSTKFFSETPFLRWADKNKITFEPLINYDIHSNSTLLSNYKLLIVVGHSEYWSYPERVEVQNFVKNGGKVMILSGNTTWWQVRYEDNGKTLVCYKDKNLDPLNGVNNQLVTVNWRNSPVNYPENIMTGLSLAAAGYINYGSILPVSQGYGGYTIANDHYWPFKGTGLLNGDNISYKNDIAGYESDGALFSFKSGTPVFTGADMSPTNFRVLGFSPAYQNWGFTTTPHAFMGMFRSGNGMVFNGASIYWVKALETDYRVSLIANNIINKFIENRFPPDIISWSPANVVTKYIRNENVPINNRQFLKKTTSGISFSVSTKDPYGGTVSYRWLLNDASVSTGSASYSLSSFNPNRKINKITAMAYNTRDTAMINWYYFNKELVLYGDQKLKVYPGSYYFSRILTFNYYNDSIIYSYSGPSWLTLSSNGELKGNATSTTGNYSIRIIASNQHSQKDTLKFTLTVTTSLPKIILAQGIYKKGEGVLLTWNSDADNDSEGYDVERRNENSEWNSIASVKIDRNNLKSEYSYIDKNVEQTKYYYRFKQIGIDGSFEYSNEVEVDVNELPGSFDLTQNYPNPFNPSTIIRYSVPFDSKVEINIYNSISQLVRSFPSETKAAGTYEIEFKASDLPSGVYIYELIATPLNSGKVFRAARKMILLK